MAELSIDDVAKAADVRRSTDSRAFSRPEAVKGGDAGAGPARRGRALTTVRQPIADMGNIAIDLAEKKSVEGSVEQVVLTPELLVRATTAGPPA